MKGLIRQAKQRSAAPDSGRHAGNTEAGEEAQSETMPASLSLRAPVLSESCVIQGAIHRVLLAEDWLQPEEEMEILRKLRAHDHDFLQLRGKRTARFGGDPGPPCALKPLPPWLAELCAAVGKAVSVDGCAKTSWPAPNHVLVNHYRPGEGIMPHTDGPAYAPLAAILSLGSAVVFDFWRDHAHPASGHPAVLSLLLPPRSLLVFSEEAYQSHLHGIADRAFDELDSDVANWTLETQACWLGISNSMTPADWASRQLEEPAGCTLQGPPDADGGVGITEANELLHPFGLRRQERYSLTIRHVPLAATAAAAVA